nr:MAG TPA: hypothetical protein [Caudoviricetes sp.]
MVRPSNLYVETRRSLCRKHSVGKECKNVPNSCESSRCNL